MRLRHAFKNCCLLFVDTFIHLLILILKLKERKKKDTEIKMSEGVSESTPLLAEESVPAATPAGTSSDNDNTSADEHYARLRRRFVILTFASVFLSIIGFASSVAVDRLVAQFAPSGWYLDWTTTDMNRYMVVTVSRPLLAGKKEKKLFFHG